MQIARVFLDVHMGKNFTGLLDILRKEKVNNQLNQYVVFINSKHTKFKVLVGDKYLVYHDNKDKRFPIDAIKYLPLAFEGKEFKFSKAVEKLIKEKYG